MELTLYYVYRALYLRVLIMELALCHGYRA